MNLERKKVTAARVGFHPVHLMRLVREGRFPKPVRLGPNSIAFVTEEVSAWIEQRIAERDVAEAGAPHGKAAG